MLERFAFYLVATVLTVLDGLFWVYNLFHRVPIRFPETDTWTDEEIIRAVESAPYLEGSDDKLVQISEDILVKFGRDWDSTASEALAMELVRKQTRITVPRMRRAIRHHQPEGNGLVVMDLVPKSQQLRVAWPSLSVLGKLKVVLTMISALETYFRKEHNAAEDRASRGRAPSPNCKPLDASAFASLIFTHDDLNMRNLLLDNHHVLWVVDWRFSGFYPPWYEYLGMRYAAPQDRNLESWQKCIRYIAEPAFEVEECEKDRL